MKFHKDSRYYAFCAEMMRYIENNGRCFANTQAQVRFLNKLYFSCECKCVDDALKISFSDYSRMWDVGVKSLYVLFGEPAIEWWNSKKPESRAKPGGYYALRNREIAKERESGMTFAEIGKRHGISTSRVQQICSRIERAQTTLPGAWLRDEIKQ